jgi:hypothetical protein
MGSDQPDGSHDQVLRVHRPCFLFRIICRQLFGLIQRGDLARCKTSSRFRLYRSRGAGARLWRGFCRKKPDIDRVTSSIARRIDLFVFKRGVEVKDNRPFSSLDVAPVVSLSKQKQATLTKKGSQPDPD